jgi:hypothetical protein
MAYKAQPKVPSMSSISIAANRLFCSPNCRGVKAKLKSRFRIKGNKTQNGMTPFMYEYTTYPKEMKISTYNTLHTGPNSQLGGAHSGLIRVWYQVSVFILKL